MTTTNSLQELIEKKAIRRLKYDLLALYETLSQNRLLTYNDVPLLRIVDGEKTLNLRIGNIFLVKQSRDYDTNTIIYVEGSYAKELYQHWLPIYIKEETDLFVQKVDTFQEQIEELKSGINQDYD